MSRKVESALVTRIRCQKQVLEEKLHIDKRQSRRQSVLKNYNCSCGTYLSMGTFRGSPLQPSPNCQSQNSLSVLNDLIKRWSSDRSFDPHCEKAFCPNGVRSLSKRLIPCPKPVFAHTSRFRHKRPVRMLFKHCPTCD
jgi:hypothetical protein